jgi:hypothetical protein
MIGRLTSRSVNETLSEPLAVVAAGAAGGDRLTRRVRLVPQVARDWIHLKKEVADL